MDVLTLTGLIKIEFPSATVRLCDGGFLVVGSDTYVSSDATFGTVGGLESLNEGVGDEIPACALTLLPQSGAAVADLCSPTMQGSRVRFYIAEVNPATGLVVGTPDLQADLQTDRATLKLNRGERSVTYDLVSRAERLFLQNEGNTLSPDFHKSIWSGETGEDNAIGLTLSVAWGIESPPRGSSDVNYHAGGIGSFDLGNYVNYV